MIKDNSNFEGPSDSYEKAEKAALIAQIYELVNKKGLESDKPIEIKNNKGIKFIIDISLAPQKIAILSIKEEDSGIIYSFSQEHNKSYMTLKNQVFPREMSFDQVRSLLDELSDSKE